MERRGAGAHRRRYREEPQGGRNVRGRCARWGSGARGAADARLPLRRAHLQLQPAWLEGVQRRLQGELRRRRSLQPGDGVVLLDRPRADARRVPLRRRLHRQRTLLELAHPRRGHARALLAASRAWPGDRLPQSEGRRRPRAHPRVGQRQAVLDIRLVLSGKREARHRRPRHTAPFGALRLGAERTELAHGLHGQVGEGVVRRVQEPRRKDARRSPSRFHCQHAPPLPQARIRRGGRFRRRRGQLGRGERERERLGPLPQGAHEPARLVQRIWAYARRLSAERASRRERGFPCIGAARHQRLQDRRSVPRADEAAYGGRRAHRHRRLPDAHLQHQ